MLSRDPYNTLSLASELTSKNTYQTSGDDTASGAKSLGHPDTSRECSIVVGKHNRYVEVSDGFCSLVGYSREELLRMTLNDLAAPGTLDTINTFDRSKPTGYAHGLWLLVSREGTRILVRHKSRVRADLLLQSQVDLVGVGY
jgi:PAS domain S-box-containing protein